jgi:mannitol-specific phosphotransferase system IIBC component
MDRFYVTLLLALAATFAMMLAGIHGIFLLALFGAALTVGLRTGSLAPYYPTVSRDEAPAKFWIVMAACAAILLINALNLLWPR